MSSTDALAGLFDDSDDDTTTLPTTTVAAPASTSTEPVPAASPAPAAAEASPASPAASAADAPAATSSAPSKKTVASSFGVTRRPRVVVAKGAPLLISTPALPSGPVAAAAAAAGPAAAAAAADSEGSKGPLLPAYPSNATVAVASLPSMIAVADAAYDPATYTPAALTSQLSAGRAAITGGIDGVIRWRKVPDAAAPGGYRVESNARLIRWPDGTEQLQVGGEVFTLKRQGVDPLAPSLLFAPVPATNAKAPAAAAAATVLGRVLAAEEERKGPNAGKGVEDDWNTVTAPTAASAATTGGVINGTESTLPGAPALHCVAQITQRIKIVPHKINPRTQMAVRAFNATRAQIGRSAVHSAEIYSSKEMVRLLFFWFTVS